MPVVLSDRFSDTTSHQMARAMPNDVYSGDNRVDLKGEMRNHNASLYSVLNASLGRLAECLLWLYLAQARLSAQA